MADIETPIAQANTHQQGATRQFYLQKANWLEIVNTPKLLTAAERLIAKAIADHVNHDPKNLRCGFAWPSWSRLAAKCGVTERTVSKSIKRLEDMGLLAVQRHAGQRGRGGTTHRYALRLPPVADIHAQLTKTKERKTFPLFADHENSDLTEREEVCAPKGGKTAPEEGKILPTSLFKDISRNSAAPMAGSDGEVQQTSNEKKKKDHRPLRQVTSQDHTELAKLIGDGDVENGYRIIDERNLTEAEVDKWALRYRRARHDGARVCEQFFIAFPNVSVS